MGGFGTIRNLHGNAIDLASLAPGDVMLNKEASDELEAQPGDQIVLYSPTGQLPGTRSRRDQRTTAWARRTPGC